VATQLTVVFPKPKVLPLGGVQVTSAAPQLSVTVGLKTITWLQLIKMFVVTLAQAMAGASISLTVTENVQLALLPTESVTVHVNECVPTGMAEPLEYGLQLTLAPLQLSEALGVNVTTAEHTPGSVFFTMFAGQVIVGTCASLTVTLKLQSAPCPAASCTVQ
jgi:hypothetical protein